MVNSIAFAIVAASTLLSSSAYSSEALKNSEHQMVIQQEASVTESGSLWLKGKYSVEGAFRFEDRDDGTYLVVGSDFITKKGPDLKFVLSPMEYTSVKSKTALKGSLIIGQLKAFSGAQEFKLPVGTDASSYKSLLVHCEEKTKLWGSAPINSGNLVAHGSSWIKKSSTITGHWEIARTETGLVLRLGSDFKTKKAPDLVLILSTMEMKVVNGENAADGGLEFTTLKSVSGQSEYLIKGVDSLDGYKSLVIHCEQYAKCWGGAPLN